MLVCIYKCVLENFKIAKQMASMNQDVVGEKCIRMMMVIQLLMTMQRKRHGKIIKVEC